MSTFFNLTGVLIAVIRLLVSGRLNNYFSFPFIFISFFFFFRGGSGGRGGGAAEGTTVTTIGCPLIS